MAFKLKNFTVEAFNRDVNQSGDLLRKYNAWSGYRAQLSALIGEAFARSPQIDHALVLAAGNLNDIDLRFLCGKLNHLSLSDADLDAMERGINRQNLTDGQRARITAVQSDYTGAVQAGFFQELEALARKRVPVAELADHIQCAMSTLASAPVQPFAETYPLVISCPVYTQLLYTQIEVFLKLLFEAKLYSYKDLNLILNAAYGAMPGILARYNAMVMAACEPGGLIMLLSDMMEMETDSRAFRAVQKVSKDGPINAPEAEALIDTYGSELAIIGRRDLHKRVKPLQETYWFWPFDDGKAYLVSVCLAQNNMRQSRP